MRSISPEVLSYLQKKKLLAQAGVDEDQKMYSDSFGKQFVPEVGPQRREVWPEPRGPEDIQPPVPKENEINFTEPAQPEPEVQGTEEGMAAGAITAEPPVYMRYNRFGKKLTPEEYEWAKTYEENAKDNDEREKKDAHFSDAIKHGSAGGSSMSDILYTAYTGKDSPAKATTQQRFGERNDEIQAYLKRRQQRIDNEQGERQLDLKDRGLDIESTIRGLTLGLDDQKIRGYLDNLIRDDERAQQIVDEVQIPQVQPNIDAKAAQAERDRAAAERSRNTPPPPPPRDPIQDAQDKDDIKRRTKIAEENRKKRTALQADRAQWEDLERTIDDGIAQAEKYSKRWAGTGRAAQARSLLGGIDAETQALDTTLNKLSLDQMTKQFSGMSKLMDTKAEQAKFQKSVPSIGMDDGNLMKELKLRKEAAQRAKQRIDEALSKFDEEGNPVSGGSKTIVKKQYSPSRNKTRIIYSDGTEEMRDGEQ
jgi:hypothetical protein